MKKVFLLILIALHYSAHASEEGLYAWWLTIEFPVTKTSILSHPVTQLDKTWRKAELLSDGLLKKYTRPEEYQEFKNSNMQFQLQADLNNNKIKEYLYTGVYKAKNGATGKFVAIFESNKLLKVFTRQGKAGYSALLQDNEQVSWYGCMQCGEYETITWDGKRYRLE